MTRSIAVIGGGIAGLACARTMGARGDSVTVFDKGGVIGGRLSGRSVGTATCDFGATYFTARDPRFVRVVHDWERDGICARWHGRIAATDGRGHTFSAPTPIERFVGVPLMNAVATQLAKGLMIRTGHRVDAIERASDNLVLRGTISSDGRTLPPALGEGNPLASFGDFDAVAVCIPASQVAALLDEPAPALAAVARNIEKEPCLVAGIETDDPSVGAIPYDGVFVGRDDTTLLSWVARDSSKPGRPPGERWVLHAGPRASRAHWDAPPEETIEAMVGAFRQVFALPSFATSARSYKRWAFARAKVNAEREDLYDSALAIGLAGDFVHGGRVEGAFLSGLSLAERMRCD